MPLFTPEQAKALGRFGGIGLEMAALLLIGVYGGRWLDARFDTGRTLELAGLFFGIAAGFYNLLKLARQTAPPAPAPPEAEEPATDLERIEALVADLTREARATTNDDSADSSRPSP
ncbi:MAG: AtpZ/AtpI family protein [Myxococcota bacterium]